jgi:hypothetical protein
VADSKTVPLLGRHFWTALIRGSYQGAAYFVDLLMKNREP